MRRSHTPIDREIIRSTKSQTNGIRKYSRRYPCIGCTQCHTQAPQQITIFSHYLAGEIMTKSYHTVTADNTHLHIIATLNQIMWQDPLNALNGPNNPGFTRTSTLAGIVDVPIIRYARVAGLSLTSGRQSYSHCKSPVLTSPYVVDLHFVC